MGQTVGIFSYHFTNCIPFKFGVADKNYIVTLKFRQRMVLNK